MCIIYRAVPSLPDELAKQGFGRIVPLTLGLLIASHVEREALRLASKAGDWGCYVPTGGDEQVRTVGALERMIRGGPADIKPLVLAAVWGGPPAVVDERGVARLSSDDVAEVAAELASRDEADLRAAFHRERACLATWVEEDTVVEWYALLHRYFAAAAATARGMAICWEYA